MTDIKYFNLGTPVAGPYTPSVKVGDLIFVSGQGPAAEATNIKEQTSTTLENIKKILEATGSNVSKIVSISVFMKNMKDFEIMNQAYREFFEMNGVNDKFPARTTVEVSNLPIKKMLIEINAIAAI